MMVLSRKTGNCIQVGDVVFKVIGIRGSTVRIGIEAPKALKITWPDAKQANRKEQECLPNEQ